MSSNAIPHVLIIGATGTLGSNLVKGFQLPQYNNKSKLSLLVRKETAEKAGPKKDALDAFVKNGATLVYGDLDQSEAELTKAFAGVDVLISAAGIGQLGDQFKLLAPAKAANVRWLVPSSFGSDDVAIGTGSIVPFIDTKLKLLSEIKAAGFDWTVFNTGTFSEFVLSGFFGVDLAGPTVTAPGSFSVATNTTPLAEVGINVADAILSGKGKNQAVYTGVPITYEDIAVAIEKATGKKVNRVDRPLAESEAAVAKDGNDIIARFAVLLGKQGKGISWPVSETYAAKNGLTVPNFEAFVKKALAQ